MFTMFKTITQHPFNYKPKASSKKQAMLDSFSKPQHCSETHVKDITDWIINTLVLDLRPVYMVECEEFKDLVACLEPGYTVHSCKLIMNMIRRKHEVGKQLLCEKLKMTSFGCGNDRYLHEQSNPSIDHSYSTLHHCRVEGDHSPASDSAIIQQFKQNLTSSWVLAPAVDPRFRELKFLDQAAIETVKSELVSRMEVLLCSNTQES